MSTKYMKNVLRGCLVSCAIGAAITACTDKWDEHYDDSPLASANHGTLWQAMQQNGQLTNFCRVVQECGYDKALQSSQIFSVFAPVDARFTSAQADSVIALYKSEVQAEVRTAENRAIKEFLQNHIARYTHSVAEQMHDSIVVMMNGKYIDISNSQFGGKGFNSRNQLYENGVLFTIDEPVKFYNNVFEYIQTDKGGDWGLDSLAAFMYDRRYYLYELDEDKSIQGEIVNGKVTYLDSVMVKSNELFYYLGWLNSEDSTYWMAAPTNKAWRQMVEEFEPYFMYNTKVDKYDSLRWSQPRLAIVRGTVFSQTLNPGLAAYPGDTHIDSLRSTNAYSYSNRTYAYGTDTIHYYQYGDERHPQNPFQEGGAFYQAAPVQCSNGWLMKSNDWMIDKRETFFHDIVVEAENAQFYYDPTTTNRNIIVTRVLEKNKYYNRISGNRYLQVSPKNASVHNPDIAFYVPNVLSNVPYDIYLVTIPADVTDTLMTEDQLLPSLLQISRCYKDIDGEGLIYDSEEIKANDKRFRDKDHFLGDFDGAKGKGYGYGKDVDTICIAKGLTFPSCSWGLDNPQVQIRLMSNVLTFPPFIDMYDRVLRIDCIIFRPRFDATDEQ